MGKLRFLTFTLWIGLFFSCSEPLSLQYPSPVLPSNNNSTDDTSTDNKIIPVKLQGIHQPSDKQETTIRSTINHIQPNEVTQKISHLVIVSAPLFMKSPVLKRYIDHKMKQGHEVKLISAEGKTAEEIRQKLKTIYEDLNKKPMAVLLVGDHMDGYRTGTGAYVPAFVSTVGYESKVNRHPTDYYYGEYDGNYGNYDGQTGTYNEEWLQDAVVGRFCVSNDEQLQAYVDKIIYMEEEITADDPSVTRVIRTSSELDGPQTKTIGNYLSSYHGLTVKPVSIYSHSLSDSINAGTGFVVYTGHGHWNSWSGWFQNYEASELQNKVYPLVIGSTCLSGSYQKYSLAEAFMNNQKGGAVAYIGASAESYAVHNKIMTCGSDDSFNTVQPGIVGALYYDAGTDKKYRARTVGAALQAGQRAVYRFSSGPASNSVDDKTKYSLEIYNLLGDPTYIPYTQTPKSIKFRFESNAVMKGRNFVVYTAPEAKVAITQKINDGVKIISAGYANEDGKAVLSIPNTVNATDANLYAIAPNYIGRSQKIQIHENSGIKSKIATLNGITVGTHSIAVTEDKSKYSVSLAYEESSVKVSAETSDITARVTGDGTYNLKPGLNTLTLTVTAEDGINTKQYDLTIERKKTTKSKDATLKSVTVTVNGVKHILQPSAVSKYSYDIQIKPDVKQIQVEAVPTSTEAKYRIEGADTDIPIITGYPYCYMIYIYVTPEFAEDGETTYTIQVYKTNQR